MCKLDRSIIYGLWGFFFLAPFLQTTIQPALIGSLGKIPLIGILFGGAPYGIGLLTAGIILAIMVLPFITSITRDVFQTVPTLLRESSYGMGMTTWEVVRQHEWKIGPLRSVCFAPDGLRCAAGSETGQVVVWDLDD